MRRFIFIAFLFALLGSCTQDTKPVNKTDSIPDTANKNMALNDTFHADTGSKAPVYYDCSVLGKRIPPDSDETRIRHDLGQLIHCGIDSFDFLYVVPNLFPGWVSENHVSGNKNITYGDFVKHLNEFKTTEAYSQLHVHVQTLDSLRSVPFDVRKVYAMKPTLGRLGFTQPEWEMFSGFATTYPVPKKGVFTWGDMLDAFDKYKPN